MMDLGLEDEIWTLSFLPDRVKSGFVFKWIINYRT